MDTAFEVLVIVLGSLLGILLIIGIAIGILAYKVVKSIKRVVDKGEQVIDSAETAAELFKRAAGPLGVLRTLTNIVETVTKHKRSKG